MTTTSWDRTIVLAALVAIAGLAWAYLFSLGQNMSDMSDMTDMIMQPGTGSFELTTAMWVVMMVGMMLPSAAPMILLYTTVQRKRGTRPVLMTGAFASGYVLVWGGFAVAATALQIILEHVALLSSSGEFISAKLAGLTFLLAAAYEFSPLKNRCLRQCNSPLGFITVYWRPGTAGGLRMGYLHGLFCVGCCWALMLLLFTAGVMNLFWVAALAVLVLVQKVLPYGRLTTTVTGTMMAAVGVTLIVL